MEKGSFINNVYFWGNKTNSENKTSDLDSDFKTDGKINPKLLTFCLNGPKVNCNFPLYFTGQIR